MTLLDALSLDWQTKARLAERMDLYTASGKPDTRRVELEVIAARLAGAAVISGGDGYRLARNATEVDDCLRRLRTRAIRQLLTARAMRLTRDRLRAAEARPQVIVAPVPPVPAKPKPPDWPAWR